MAVNTVSMFTTYRALPCILLQVKVLVVLHHPALHGGQVLGAHSQAVVAVEFAALDVVPPAIKLAQVQARDLCVWTTMSTRWL